MKKTIQFRVVQKQRDVKLRAGRLADAVAEVRKRRIGKGVLYKITRSTVDTFGRVEEMI